MLRSHPFAFADPVTFAPRTRGLQAQAATTDQGSTLAVVPNREAAAANPERATTPWTVAAHGPSGEATCSEVTTPVRPPM